MTDSATPVYEEVREKNEKVAELIDSFYILRQTVNFFKIQNKKNHDI